MCYVIEVLYKYVPISFYYFVRQTGTIFDLCLAGMRYGGAEVNHPCFLFISNRYRLCAGQRAAITLLRRKKKSEPNIKDLQTFIHLSIYIILFLATCFDFCEKTTIREFRNIQNCILKTTL